MKRGVRTIVDLMELLDGLFAPETGVDRWDRFYADRSRSVPFFVDKPDENLVARLPELPRGRALDLGCGPGRNAVHLASAGFEVDAVDLSPVALAWAAERAREAGVEVRFHRGDVFAVTPDGPYDLVYDSGLFHHLPPHRRISYLDLLDRVLAPGGHFGLVAFAEGEMGSERPDADLYRAPGLDGGLAYGADDLRVVFADFEEVELRRMVEQPAGSPHYGTSFLWAALFRRPVAPVNPR